MNIKTDKYGFKYVDELPDGFVPGNIRHFIDGNKAKIGLEYLLHNYAGTRYEVHIVTENTRSESILPFIKSGQLYVRA